MIYIFPDTNIFLHYRSFDELDWLSFAGMGETEATVVVSFTVVHELDEHKRRHDGPRNRRKRAGDVSGRLWKYLDSENPARLPTGVNLQTPQGEPVIDFEEHGLTKDNQDDQILASVIQFEQENANVKVCIVSADTGIKLKARMRSINVVSPPDDHLLPPVQDEVEAENRRLKRELDQLKSRSPRIGIAFANGEQRLTVKLTPVEPITNATVNRRRARLRSGFKVDPPPPGTMAARLPQLFPLAEVRESDRSAFLQDIDEYVEAFEAYLRTASEAEVVKSLSFPVEIVVHNTGTGPAVNVDAYVLPPDGVRAAGHVVLPDVHSVPTRPKPGDRMVRKMIELSSSFSSDRMPSVEIERIPRLQRPGEARFVDGADDLQLHIPVLKHGEVGRFPLVYLSFEDRDGIKNFRLRVRITSDTLLEPETTTLHVLVEAAPPVPCPEIPDPDDN